MNTKLVDSLVQIISSLSDEERQLLEARLGHLQSDHVSGQHSRLQQWNEISDEEAFALRAEFAEEDVEMAEAALRGYLPCLQQEDAA